MNDIRDMITRCAGMYSAAGDERNEHKKYLAKADKARSFLMNDIQSEAARLKAEIEKRDAALKDATDKFKLLANWMETQARESKAPNPLAPILISQAIQLRREHQSLVEQVMK